MTDEHCGQLVVELPSSVKKKSLKQLNIIANKPQVDVEFEDLVYAVNDPDKGWRQLLKGVSGKFRSGELTAILGPSGAGKSTLLNILAGYVTTRVQGTIRVNNRPRNMKVFNKLSTYIMQEDLIQPLLTVREAMFFAASLKLGPLITHKDKLSVIEEVIDLLGLQNCYETRSEHLSGGQRKRLAIALELVNNPPVIFLDEPTSGLDNYSIKQCMDLLQKISQIGRTVVCTIHQPPASLFQTFNQVYVMADGNCVYNGSPSQLVPFLSKSGFPCPRTYTPADYSNYNSIHVIEIVQSNSHYINLLSEAVQNGRTNLKNEPEILTTSTDDGFSVYNDTTQSSIIKSDITFPTPLWLQHILLIRRMFLQGKRNKSVFYIQFFHHVLSGCLVAGIFYGIGNKASQTVAIFKCCMSIAFFFMYTHVMTPVLLFPMEVDLMKREYFNRWYSLKAYYLAMTISSLPLLIFPGIIFISIVYFVTDQPLEFTRFTLFMIMGIVLGLCSQSLGYAIGSTLNITKGSIVAASSLAVILALAAYGMGYRDGIEPIMKVFMAFSFMRFGVSGFCISIFNGRAPLKCDDEIYCHYRNPELLMRDFGMAGSHYSYHLLCVIFYTLFFRIVGYLALKCRLNSDISQKLVYYAKKVIKRKDSL